MIDISMPGLIGAIVGTAVAGVSYHLLIGSLDRKMQEQAHTRTAEERDTMETRMSLLRRTILTAELFLFAALGYFIGHTVWG